MNKCTFIFYEGAEKYSTLSVQRVRLQHVHLGSYKLKCIFPLVCSYFPDAWIQSTANLKKGQNKRHTTLHRFKEKEKLQTQT
jgi:hypothetical protein